MTLNTTWAEQDLRRHEREHEEWLRSRPVCDLCGDPIEDDVYFEPEPNTCYCGECFRQYVIDNYLRDIE